VVPADWLNATQEEIANAVTAFGGTLSKTNRTQLTAAINTAVGGAFPVANGTLSTSGTISVSAGGTFYNVGGSSTTQTLPAASTATGQSFGFYATSAFTLASAGGYIYGDGISTTAPALAAGQFICVQSDGASWRIFSASPGLGRSVPPAVSRSAQGILICASYSGSQTVSFTAPCAGYVYATASLNLAAVASAGIACSLIINGLTVASDNTLLAQSHIGVVAIAAGAAVTASVQVTATTSSGITATYMVGAIFVPSP
jgi:hypothetical protein